MVTLYSTATNVEIELPVPADATNPNVRTSIGSAKYAPERDALVWKIKSFPGNKVTIRLKLHIISPPLKYILIAETFAKIILTFFGY